MVRSSSHLGAIVTTLFLLGWFVTILFGFTRTADAQYSVPAYRGLSVRQNPAAAMPFNGSAAQVPVAAQVPGPAPRRMALQAAPPRGPNPRLQAAAPVNGLRTVTPVNRMQQQVVDEEEPLPLPQVAGGQLAGQPLDEPAGEVYYEEGQDVGVPVYGGGIAGCDAYPYEGAGGPGYYEAATCDAYGPGYCGNEAVTPPLIYIDWRRFDAYFGTQAFTGPLNFAGTGANRATHDGSGSFGFHEAFNYGRNLPYAFSGELSEQLGLRATQSNFAGLNSPMRNAISCFLRQACFVAQTLVYRAAWSLIMSTTIGTTALI